MIPSGFGPSTRRPARSALSLYLSWAALGVTLLAAVVAALAIASGYPIDLPLSKPKLSSPGQLALVLRWTAGGLGLLAAVLGVVAWAIGGPWRVVAAAVAIGFAVLALEWFLVAMFLAMLIIGLFLAFTAMSA